MTRAAGAGVGTPDTGGAHTHNAPALPHPAGTLATRAGTIMAASDRFNFTVLGKGGHGAMPHLAADPVVAASAVVMALQTLVGP
jgi:metal-dependent amidase/aminoacylase/carboxypeptidase family protein